MRALQPDVQPVVHARGGVELHRRLLHVEVALQLVHALLVRHRQRPPVVRHRRVEVHQVVGVEDDLLHVHFRPADAQPVEETEVFSFHCHACARAAAASRAPAGLRERAAHLDEFVGDAAVDLQPHRDAGCAQFIRVLHAVVRQRVAFGQPEPGRRHAFDLGRVQRREAPVLAVGVVYVLPEVLDVRLLQHQALVVAAMRRPRPARRRSPVEQQLQRQRQARVARERGADGGTACRRHCRRPRQGATCPRPAPRPPRHPLQGGPRVVGRRREAMLRCQPVAHGNDRAARALGQRAAQRVVRGDAADGEAAAVEVHQHRQALRRGRDQACRDLDAGRHRDAQVLHPRQVRPRHLQHAGARLVGGARLLRRKFVQRDVPGARHALEHGTHGRGQFGKLRKKCHALGSAGPAAGLQ